MIRLRSLGFIFLLLMCAPLTLLAGGYTLGSGPLSNIYNPSLNTGTVVQPETPIFQQLTNDPYGGNNSTTLSNGLSTFITTAGDPVNMATGNMYHSERDLMIKGRGGLPLVFERSYNSRQPVDGPLGFGWTHSFNHRLKLYGVEGGVAKVSRPSVRRAFLSPHTQNFSYL